MSLKLIYGVAGTGKSTEIFNEIKKNIYDETNKYIITPEQFSFSAEKNLLNILEKNSVVNTEVITFNRMADRVFAEIGGKNDVLITKSGKAMLIYSILEEQKNDLTFLKNTQNNIELVMNTIKEFKKHGINLENLKEAINESKNQLLTLKLKDIEKIYEQYEKSIKARFIDEEDKLTKLANRLEKSGMFNDSEIYIDEFSGFTKQEYDIIKILLKKAKRVTVSFCMDSLNIGKPETDIFYSNKKTWSKLENIAKELNIEVEAPLCCNKNYKFKNEELKHLEENLYNIPYKKYEKETKNIFIKLSLNPYKQIEEVAKNITKLVRDEGLRYRDIAIISNNMEEYASTVKAILKETNNIPVFIDEKTDLNKSQIIRFVLSVMEIFSTNWSTEAVLNYIKSGLIEIEQNELYDFENYVIKWGIKGNKWYKEDWEYEEQNPNILRKKIVDPLLKLKEEVTREKNALNISKVIYNFINSNNIYDNIEKKMALLKEQNEILVAKNYKQSFEILIDVIDEMVEIFKEEKMNFAKYNELLQIGLSYKELGNIPEVLDQVILGDVERTRSTKIKVAFIIGVNDGVFPKVNKNEGFLNDEDRNILKSMGKEIAKGTLELLYEEEQFGIYKAFTTPEEKLYILYNSSDKDGKALRPSIIISKLKKIFPNLIETGSVVDDQSEITTKESTFKDLLINLRKRANGEEIDEIWYEVYNYYISKKEWSQKLINAEKGLTYTNMAEQISKENVRKLFGKTLKTSISKLETYNRCPYSFILKYGLRLKEKEEFKIKTIDTGTFMHDVVDTFFKNVVDIQNLEYKDIAKIINKIIDEKLSLRKNYMFTSSKKFIVLTNRLKKLITKSIEHIVYQIKNSDFDILANELEFTKKIENVEITGKIDRLDISKDGEYIRIIDYKSSNKNINLNDVFAGIQIQLITYMDVISEKQQKLPAGVLYFNLIQPIINASKNLTDEEIEEKIRNEFKMKGLILADIKIAKMMDKTMEKGSSSIIPVYIDKEGKISNSRSSVVSKEEFSKLQFAVRNIISQVSREILNGNMDIKPIYDKKTKVSACNYCEFNTICRFDTKENCYNYIGNKTKEELLNGV